jgi:hypothetical protein
LNSVVGISLFTGRAIALPITVCSQASVAAKANRSVSASYDIFREKNVSVCQNRAIAPDCCYMQAAIYILRRRAKPAILRSGNIRELRALRNFDFA